MASAQDPFYIVKDEIQQSIDKLLSAFHRWEHLRGDSQQQQNLSKELLIGCESIEWQVDELDKAIAVATTNPSRYGTDEVEINRRRRWTSTARTQVNKVKNTVSGLKDSNGTSTSNVEGMRRELMRLSDHHQKDGSNNYNSHDNDNDDFISSESDRQLLLIKQQDEELDELSASVVKFGHIGLTIHDELLGQDRIIGDLGTEMENTSNRLNFVQKKVGTVMKKAGAKGQIMMILFLVLMFVILFVLVFLT